MVLRHRPAGLEIAERAAERPRLSNGATVSQQPFGLLGACSCKQLAPARAPPARGMPAGRIRSPRAAGPRAWTCRSVQPTSTVGRTAGCRGLVGRPAAAAGHRSRSAPTRSSRQPCSRRFRRLPPPCHSRSASRLTSRHRSPGRSRLGLCTCCRQARRREAHRRTRCQRSQTARDQSMPRQAVSGLV